MLDRMRRHKSWLKWSLALVVLTFIIFYIPDFLRRPETAVGATSGEVVADVDGHELTAGEFRIRYEQQVRAYRTQFGGSVNEQLLRQLGVEQQVLRDMIAEQLAVDEAARRGITVTNEELAQEIMTIPAFNENGQFIGEARYREILQSNNPPLSISEFEEGMRRSMVVNKLRSAITDWMSISDSELEKSYKERNEKVKLQVLALTAEKFRDKVTATDVEVGAHYDAHKAEYRVGEQRKVKYLLFDAQQARLKVAVTPQEVERYYNQNVERYRTPEQVRASHILLKTEGKDETKVRAEAEDLLKQVKAGGDFPALARKYSEDDGSKANGGDLDYFGRGRMVPEFDTVAFQMQPGQISDLVKSQFGFHIIKVTDRKPEVTRPLDEVRAEIQEQLLTQKANELVAKQATDLTNLKTVADMEKAAAANGTKVLDTGFFTREKPAPELVTPDASQRAFTLKDGEVSGPFSTPRGPVFIALAGKQDPYVPKLDEVRDRVRDDVIRTKAAELSRARAKEIAAALSSARDFAAAAKTLGFEAKETALITRSSPLPDVGTSPEVDKVAFTLPVGGTSEPIPTSDGTVIIRVSERADVKPDDFRKGREAFRAQLLEERRNKFYNAYMDKVREKMTINIKPDVLQRVVSTDSI
jgi:peptidyl-prolyl cis-trans isomerase D